MLSFKKPQCHGGKMSKGRITVLVGCSADGSDCLPLLVIGKSKNPRSFKNVQSLPVDYNNSKKAWMTWDMLWSWLQTVNRRFRERGRPYCYSLTTPLLTQLCQVVTHQGHLPPT